MPHPAPRARILYFHGNGGNLSVWAPILAGIHRRGYAVHAFDYRGYGASTGRPSEQGLYRDVEAAAAWPWETEATGSAADLLGTLAGHDDGGVRGDAASSRTG